MPPIVAGYSPTAKGANDFRRVDTNRHERRRAHTQCPRWSPVTVQPQKAPVIFKPRMDTNRHEGERAHTQSPRLSRATGDYRGHRVSALLLSCPIAILSSFKNPSRLLRFNYRLLLIYSWLFVVIKYPLRSFAVIFYLSVQRWQTSS